MWRGEDGVERGDKGVDVLAFEDVRRQEAEDGLAGAVDDDAVGEHVCRDVSWRGPRSRVRQPIIRPAPRTSLMAEWRWARDAELVDEV